MEGNKARSERDWKGIMGCNKEEPWKDCELVVHGVAMDKKLKRLTSPKWFFRQPNKNNLIPQG